MLQDVINEGMKIAATGSSLVLLTDQVVFALPPDRAVIVCGYTLSTSSVTPVFVSLGFKDGVNPTKTFFNGYVSANSGPICVSFQLGDWYRGNVNEAVVITSDGAITWTVDTRVTQSPTVTGYIEHEASQLHSGRANYPPENGLQRGQW